MPVSKTKKEAALADIQTAFASSAVALFTDFQGVDVAGITDLRRRLREQGCRYVVTKRTLAEKTLTATAPDTLETLLAGGTGIVFTNDEPIAVAKVLVDFKTEYEKFAIKGGLLGGEYITGDQVKALAKIPPRDVLLAMLLGVMKAPHRNFVGVLQGVVRKFVGTLDAVADKMKNSETAA